MQLRAETTLFRAKYWAVRAKRADLRWNTGFTQERGAIELLDQHPPVRK